MQKTEMQALKLTEKKGFVDYVRNENINVHHTTLSLKKKNANEIYTEAVKLYPIIATPSLLFLQIICKKTAVKFLVQPGTEGICFQ